jgi:hypothetical protein
MEILDRIKQKKKDCQIACLEILKILRENNSRRILLCLEMVEIFSKNGNLEFHKYIGTTKFS